jgi:amidohydrolase
VKKLLLFVAAMSSTSPVAAATLSEVIHGDMPQLMTLYRDLHANPELSMQEVRTPAKLAAEVRKLGFEVTEHVGKTGVVAVMKNGSGPVLLIRADMDALPVQEQTGLPFASKAVGKLPDGTVTPVMHACGHDTHITTWLATARRLASMKDQWSGTVVMVLQPGEEVGMGATGMLADGLFTRFPKPDYLLAFHDSAAMRSRTSIPSTSSSKASAAMALTRRPPRIRLYSPAV